MPYYIPLLTVNFTWERALLFSGGPRDDVLLLGGCVVQGGGHCKIGKGGGGYATGY